jgi:hypothetical protein
MSFNRDFRSPFDARIDGVGYSDLHIRTASNPVPMPPGPDILARRLSGVPEAELKRVLEALSRMRMAGATRPLGDHYAKPIACLIIELTAKAMLNRYGGRVYASVVDFDHDPVDHYSLRNVFLIWRSLDDKDKSGHSLDDLVRQNLSVWTDLSDIIRISLEKSATPPPKPSRDDEILVRLQQIEGALQQQQSATFIRLQQVEGMLQQQQSATLALTTMCGWLLRSIPPTVWESGGAETVRLIGELADAVAPWADENPAAAEASLRAARAVGAPQSQAGPAPAVARPSDAVKAQVETHSGKPGVAAEPLDDDKVQADALKTQFEAFVRLEKAMREVIERSGWNGSSLSVTGYRRGERVFFIDRHSYDLQPQPGVSAYDLLRKSIRSKLRGLYLEGMVVDKIRFDGQDCQCLGIFVDVLGPFPMSTADIL